MLQTLGSMARSYATLSRITQSMTVTDKPFFCVAPGRILRPATPARLSICTPPKSVQLSRHIHSLAITICLPWPPPLLHAPTHGQPQSLRTPGALQACARACSGASLYQLQFSAEAERSMHTYTQRHGHIYELVYVSLQCAGLFISGGAAPLRHAVPLLLHWVSALTASCTRPRWDKPKGPSVG
jgi:hypothetical protein